MNALTVGAVAGWSFYILYVLWALARFNADFSDWDVVLGMLIPVGMLAGALWLRFWLATKLHNWLPGLAQAFILAAACLFLASILLPRA